MADAVCKHKPVVIGGYSYCWVCCKAARSLAALERRPCNRRHEGTELHRVWEVGGHFFCITCGARTQKRFRLLSRTCSGAPPSDSKARELARLKRGIPPGCTEAVGVPAPMRESRVVQDALRRPVPGVGVFPENVRDIRQSFL